MESGDAPAEGETAVEQPQEELPKTPTISEMPEKKDSETAVDEDAPSQAPGAESPMDSDRAQESLGTGDVQSIQQEKDGLEIACVSNESQDRVFSSETISISVQKPKIEEGTGPKETAKESQGSAELDELFPETPGTDMIDLTTDDEGKKEKTAQAAKVEEAEEGPAADVVVEKARSENAAKEANKEETKEGSSNRRKRKINMAWAMPPEEDPFSEAQDIDFVNVASEAPSTQEAPVPEDEPVVKRRRQRGERLRFEEFESELGEAFGYECTFPLPESMVFRLERGFENNGLRSPMGIVAFEGASADTKLVAVANTHCGSGELEFMQIKHGQISLIFKLPVNGVDCQEPTAVTALKNNGLAFLDKCGFTIVHWTETNGRFQLSQKKAFRMLKPRRGPPMFATRGKTGPCFGVFCSRKQEVGTFVNDINRGPVLFWWNPFSGQTRTVEVDINRYAQVRFAKHHGDVVALSDMNRNGFALWLVNLEGKQLKKIDLRQHAVIQPAGVTFDRNGNVLLADSKGKRILRFDEKGDYAGDVEFDVPYEHRITDISLDASGQLTILSLNKHLAFYRCEEQYVDPAADPFAETSNIEVNQEPEKSAYEESKDDFAADMAEFADLTSEQGEGGGGFSWSKKSPKKESSGGDWPNNSRDSSAGKDLWASKESKNDDSWPKSQALSPKNAWQKPSSSEENSWSKPTTPKSSNKEPWSKSSPNNDGWAKPVSPAAKTQNADSWSQRSPRNEANPWPNNQSNDGRNDSWAKPKSGGSWFNNGNNDQPRQSRSRSNSSSSRGRSRSRTPSIPREQTWGNNGAPRSSYSRSPSPAAGKTWGNNAPRRSNTRSPSPAAGKTWGNNRDRKDSWNSQSSARSQSWDSNGPGNQRRAGASSSGWGSQERTNSSAAGAGWGNNSQTRASQDAGWGNSSQEKPNSDWGSNISQTESKERNAGSDWGTKTAANDDGNWGSASTKSNGAGWGTTSSSAGWGASENKSPARPSATEGWGAQAKTNSPAKESGSGWGAKLDSPQKVKPDDNGWGNAPETNSPATTGWGAPAKTSSASESAWGTPQTKDSLVKSSGGWGAPEKNSSPVKTTEGWGAPARDQSPVKANGGNSGWGAENKASPVETVSTGWGAPEESNSTWGSHEKSDNPPAKTTSGWGAPEPEWGNASAPEIEQEPMQSDSASGWGESGATAEPATLRNPPVKSPAVKRWELKPEPVETPSSKFLEGIMTTSTSKPTDPRLKKRISLGDYKKRPTSTPSVEKANDVVVIADSPAPAEKDEKEGEEVKLVAETPAPPKSEEDSAKETEKKGEENLNESFEEPYSPESPAFEPAEGPIPPAPLVLPAPPTAAEEEELQKSVLADLEEPKLKMLL